ncbi:MAG: S8 family serine peptidase [Armatimonadetes bacterium]|nr:S8 family serine peptidase [Armatimonadota bacterium]
MISPVRPLLEHIPGEVLVRLKPRMAAASEVGSELGARVAEVFDFPPRPLESSQGDLVRLELPRGMTVAAALEDLSADHRVEYAEPNFTYSLQGAPATRVPDDLDPALWGLRNTGADGGKAGADIHAPEAWAVTTGSRSQGPLVAVIDTGIDFTHSDLRNNVWSNPGEVAGDGQDNDGNGVVDDVHGYNAIDDHGSPMDGHFHGTHVAGTIAAEGNNGQGVVGVNWEARLMAVKIFSDDAKTNAAAILRGLSYSTRMGARITSNSWGGGAFNRSLYEAFRDSPALHVAGAGNNASDNDKLPFYPSSYRLPNIIAVAATDSKDDLAWFSCYGKQTVDLAAPGVQILSTVPGGEYRAYNGTSMATPHVSGVAALIATRFPDATNRQIKERILLSADPLESLEGKIATGGRLNAARAVELDELPPAPPADLRVDQVDPLGVTLRWTCTGDDGWCGDASAYELRVSDRPIADEPGEGQMAFAQATAVPTGRPGASGTLDFARLWTEPAAEERKLYFALKVLDNVGNRSEMRALEVTIPAMDA